MRPDISTLVLIAKARGLKVEMHTNAAMIRDVDSRHLFSMLDRLGISLDGEDSDTHDRMRASPGNFLANLQALQIANELHLPTTVRTLVTKRNVGRIAHLGHILSRYKCVDKWSLRQFAPLGRGQHSATAFHLTNVEFQLVTNMIVQSYPANALRINVVSLSDMEDCYCLITEDGVFYGHPHDQEYQSVGKYPNDALSTIFRKVRYDRTERERHASSQITDLVRTD